MVRVSNQTKERVMALLRRSPHTAKSIAGRLEITETYARVALRSLARANLCHLSEWVGRPGKEAQAFIAGPGKPAPRPISVGDRIMLEIKASGDKGASVSDLASRLGMTKSAVGEMIRHKLRNGLRICGYQDVKTGPRLPIYAIGPGEDVPRPEWKTQYERQKAYRASAKGAEYVRQYESSIERKMKQAAAYKARAARERFRKVGLAGIDPLMAAIMGVPKHG